MKMRLVIEYEDATTDTVTVSPLAIIGWEKLSGRRMTDLASDSGGGMGMADMCQMAYEQVRLEGRTTEEFEAWCARLADINPEDTPDPTSGDEAA